MLDIGKVHSIESFSAVDGPGLRMVIFLQGCYLKCIYCHNPDSWDDRAGRLISVRQLVEKFEEYRSYLKNGGVTISGGEPLLQSDFVANLLAHFKNVHTAIETAGSVTLERALPALNAADLLILDIKSLDENCVKSICKLNIENTLNILNYCEKNSKPVWVRHVLLPGYTLKHKLLRDLAKFIKKFKCVERVELLPFHKLGEYKWHELRLGYTLENVREPTNKELEECVEIFSNEGVLALI